MKAKMKISTIVALFMLLVLMATLAWSGLYFQSYAAEAVDSFAGEEQPVDHTEILAALQRQSLTAEFQDELGGFYLAANDLIQSETTTAESVSKRVDEIVKSAKTYGFQAIMMETVLQEQTLYASTLYNTHEIDAVHTLLSAAEKEGISVYLIFHADTKRLSESTLPEEGITELLHQYRPNGLLISDYYGKADTDSFAKYMSVGGGVAYDQWLRNRVADQLDRLVSAAREVSNEVPIGVLADPVWQTKAEDQSGIDGSSDFSVYADGYADIAAMARANTFDFICVKNKTSLTDSKLRFSTVLDWWNALSAETEIPLYLIHAGENACSSKEGWSGVDQLARQLSTATKSSEYHGSFFSGYDALVADPQGSTTALLKLFAHEYKEENLFTDLTITQPTQSSITTYESTIIFRGKYDPQFDVTINGTKIIPTKEGEFYEKYNLSVGKNTFTVKHKGQQKSYSVNRKVKVFQSVSPTGTVEVDGGVELQVEAMAYRGATVIATLGKKTITLTETEGDEDSRESAYTRFVGKFTAPAATDSDQTIGAVHFKATYSSSTEYRTGGTVKVLKKITVPVWTPNSGGDGTTVIEPLEPKLQIKVITPYLEVYNPGNTVTYPCPDYTSLPAGTVDYIDYERTLTYDGITKNFYYLHSGKRVAVSDVELVTNGVYYGNNAISDLSFADEGNRTVLKLKQKWNAPYNITFGDVGYYTGSGDSDFWVKDFTSDTVTITFDYVTQVEQVTKQLLENTRMFTDIKWEKVIEYSVSRYRLHLKLNKAGGYYGCYAEYDDEGYLVLRFNRLPGSMQGVRVFMDPGHGGLDQNGKTVDPGAIGKYTENGRTVLVYESDVNLAVVKKLATKLEEQGAVVCYLTQEEQAQYRSRLNTLAQRYKAAQRWNADIFLSIHCNSNASASPKGTEVYYTTPYSMPLAREISAAISKEAATSNRGAKCNYFAVNRGRTFPSVLIEMAFISNTNEVKLLNSEAGQDKLATGILKGIQNFLK